MLLREEFYLDGLNCHPETFDLECELLNQQHHKNNTYDEIKSHHYIISHLDTDCSNNLYTGLSLYLLILFSALSAFAVVG